MTTNDIHSGGWDFAAALNLINAGHTDHDVADSSASPPPSLTHSDSSDRTADGKSDFREQPNVSLGNFDKIWQFLGTSAPDTLINYTIKAGQEEERVPKTEKEHKTVTWSDNPDIFTLDDIVGQHLEGMTKQQRKKERRRLRKLHQVEQSSGEEDAISSISSKYKRSLKHAHPASEGEHGDTKLAVKRSKERQSIIQQIVAETPAKNKKPHISNPHDFFVHQVSSKEEARQTSEPPRYNLRSTSKQKDISLSTSGANADLTNTFTKKKELLQLLNTRFASDWRTLAGLGYSCNTPYDSAKEADPTGVHVFIDISNILIGFHDAVKLKRGLSRSHKIPRQKLSFHNLSLILERGRPAAKRCLVGSDMLECIDEAREIGYETNILERVMKEKMITPRQRYFRARDGKPGASSGGEALSGTDEELQTVTKRVEQAVDEILHLKMMLSIVDTAEPSTIVLATGDAAEAEYSQGFLSMCERALSKGWRVEVVAFKHSISFAYKRKDWVDQWDGRFKVIELDEFVETLRL